MKNFVAPIVLLLIVIYILSSCATPKQVRISPVFWQQRDQTIGCAIAEHPKCNFLFEGGGGILDNLIIYALNTDLIDHMKTIDPSNFYKGQDLFVEKLKADGFNVISVEDKINLKELPKSNMDISEYPERDYRSVGQEIGVDRLIVLTLLFCGAKRRYYGPSPMGEPMGTAEVQGEMVNVKTNKLLWRTEKIPYEGNSNAKIKVKALGEWKEPPKYPNLTRAAITAIDKAVIYLYKDFFGKVPNQ